MGIRLSKSTPPEALAAHLQAMGAAYEPYAAAVLTNGVSGAMFADVRHKRRAG